MNARSNIIGKVFCLFLLAVLTLCICTPVLAASSTTTLTTTMPSHFDMNVTVIGKGTIEVNGSKLSQTGVVPTERNKEVTIKVTPDDGYLISSVIYGGSDLTQEAKIGAFILSPLEDEATIKVTFVANASTPSTGDSSYPSIVFFSIAAIISLLGIVVLLTVNRKKSNCI